MGCGCGGKSKLPVVRLERLAPVVVTQTYRNVTRETLSSRNPRFALAPGASIELEQDTIPHIVRGWIRTGLLEAVPKVDTEMPVGPIQVDPIAAEPVAKPAATKPVARKPAAKKTPTSVR